MSLQSSLSKNDPSKRKAGGSQSNPLSGISDYIGNRGEIEDRTLFRVGSPVGLGFLGYM
jgi:hypothetical protein